MSGTPAKANDKYRATLRSTFIDGVDTTLNVTAIPTNIPSIITVGWNTQYQTVFRIEGTSGTNSSNYALTGISKIKGYSGNLPEGLAVNCLNHEEYFNQYATLIAAAQADAATALAVTANYAADTGSNDTYVITVGSAVVYTTGQVYKFKANTVNTGAATLNVNSIGAKTIKKNYNLDLEDGDIKANQLVEVIYDGTNFQLLSPIANLISSIQTQAIASNLSIQKPLLQKGWNYVTVLNGASTGTVAITFPTAFSSVPDVIFNLIGIKYTTAPTLRGDLTTSILSNGQTIGIGIDSVTTTGFNLSIKLSSNAGANSYFGFSWLAIGS